MRIAPDIISEILLITKENYEYKKRIAKEKYNNVIKELKDHTFHVTHHYNKHPSQLFVIIKRYNKNEQIIYYFISSQDCYSL